MNEQRITVELKRVAFGKLKAFSDVTLPTPFGEFTIKGLRVIQQEGEEPWVAFPTSSYVKDGKTVNVAVLEFPRSLKKMIADEVLGEFKRAVHYSEDLPVRPERV